MFWATIIFYNCKTESIEQAQLYDDITGKYEVVSREQMIAAKKLYSLDVINLRISQNDVELLGTPKSRTFQKARMQGYNVYSYAYLAGILSNRYHLIIGDISNLSTVDMYYTMQDMFDLFNIDNNKLMIANAMVVGNRKNGYEIQYLDNILNDRIKDNQNKSVDNHIISDTKQDNKLEIDYKKEKGKLIIEGIGHKGIATYKVPDGVEIIEKYTGGINHLILPKSISSRGILEDFASDSEDLYKVSLEKGCGLRVIPSGCFQSSNLKEFIGFNNIKYVKDFAFCSSKIGGKLKSDSIEVIDESAFSDTKIESIELPNIRVLGNHAFSECNRLCKVSMGNKIKEIPVCAFMDCSNLSDIIIPKSVEKIHQFAFAGCSKLKKIYISGDTKIHKAAFSKHTQVVRY